MFLLSPLPVRYRFGCARSCLDDGFGLPVRYAGLRLSDLVSDPAQRQRATGSGQRQHGAPAASLGLPHRELETLSPADVAKARALLEQPWFARSRASGVGVTASATASTSTSTGGANESAVQRDVAAARAELELMLRVRRKAPLEALFMLDRGHPGPCASPLEQYIMSRVRGFSPL